MSWLNENPEQMSWLDENSEHLSWLDKHPDFYWFNWDCFDGGLVLIIHFFFGAEQEKKSQPTKIRFYPEKRAIFKKKVDGGWEHVGDFDFPVSEYKSCLRTKPADGRVLIPSSLERTCEITAFNYKICILDSQVMECNNGGSGAGCDENTQAENDDLGHYRNIITYIKKISPYIFTPSRCPQEVIDELMNNEDSIINKYFL